MKIAAKRLASAAVHRGGKTGSDWNVEHQGQVYVHVSEQWYSTKAEGVSFGFEIGSAGGGRTHLGLWIGAADFQSVAEAMIAVDPDTAKAAFKAATPRRKKLRSPNDP